MAVYTNHLLEIWKVCNLWMINLWFRTTIFNNSHHIWFMTTVSCLTIVCQIYTRVRQGFKDLCYKHHILDGSYRP